MISSVLIIQALLFADGGILALGCNIFNMGIIPCFIAYPLIYKNIIDKKFSGKRLWTACIISSIIALQIGASGVVLETSISDISELPFAKFAMLMLPIHLAIGAVEGCITAAVLILVHNLRPELLNIEISSIHHIKLSIGKVLLFFIIFAFITSGILSLFASEKPDGLEWAIGGITYGEEIHTSTQPLYSKLSNIQQEIAMLPDYSIKSQQESSKYLGTSISGIIGVIITLIISSLAAFSLKYFKSYKKSKQAV